MKKILVVLIVILGAGLVLANKVVQVKEICHICGHEEKYMDFSSYVVLESNDLDMRRGALGRDVYDIIVHKCSKCGFVNYHLSERLCSKDDLIVKNPEYQKILKLDEASESTAKHLAFAYLKERCSQPFSSIAQSLLNAAWSEEKQPEKAKFYREKSAEFFIKAQDEEKLSVEQYLVLIDVLRRSEQFEAAKNYIQVVKKLSGAKEDDIKKILEYQCHLLKKGDVDAHKISEADDFTKGWLQRAWESLFGED